MNIRRQFWAVVCTTLFVCGGTTMAQEAGKEMADRQKKEFKPMPLSSEKSARHTTDRMDSLLNLTEKQYDKLADTLRLYLNMEEVYGMLRDAGI